LPAATGTAADDDDSLTPLPPFLFNSGEMPTPELFRLEEDELKDESLLVLPDELADDPDLLLNGLFFLLSSDAFPATLNLAALRVSAKGLLPPEEDEGPPSDFMSDFKWLDEEDGPAAAERSPEESCWLLNDAPPTWLAAAAAAVVGALPWLLLLLLLEAEEEEEPPLFSSRRRGRNRRPLLLPQLLLLPAPLPPATPAAAAAADALLLPDFFATPAAAAADALLLPDFFPFLDDELFEEDETTESESLRSLQDED